MNPAAQPWILICVFCAGLCLFAAYLCKKSVGVVTKTLELDQEVFGPKRSRALERMRATVEWGEGWARMQGLLRDIQTGEGLIKDPELLRLAREGVAAKQRKEAELAGMTPEQREADIRAWAEKLSEEELGFDDKEAAGSWQKS